jgi:hypothetical protein
MKYRSFYICLILLIFLSSCNTEITEEENMQDIGSSNSETGRTSDIIYITSPSSISEEERLRKNPYALSFANSAGDKLLIFEIGRAEPLNDIPHTYDVAIDENGNKYSVKYTYAQDFNPEYDNGRQVASNFNYIRGIVYQIEGEPINIEYNSWSQSYVMCTTEFLEAHKYLEPQPLKSDYLGEIKQYVENDSNRKVNNIWQESQYENEIGFYFAYFEPIGDDLLAAAIFYDGQNIGVCYYPATMDDYGSSGWSVDDCGIIDDLTIETLCSLKSEESILTFFYWYGSEGINVELIEWDGIELIDKGSVYGRYTLN